MHTIDLFGSSLWERLEYTGRVVVRRVQRWLITVCTACHNMLFDSRSQFSGQHVNLTFLLVKCSKKENILMSHIFRLMEEFSLSLQEQVNDL